MDYVFEMVIFCRFALMNFFVYVFKTQFCVYIMPVLPVCMQGSNGYRGRAGKLGHPGPVGLPGLTGEPGRPGEGGRLQEHC